VDSPATEIRSGNTLKIEIAAALNGLGADDVLVECLIGTEGEDGSFLRHETHVLTPDGVNEHGEHIFRLNFAPRLPGLQFYKIRMYPFHHCLSHRFEAGYMIWL